MRVLMLTHRLPYAPNRGDRLRAYHMLRAIRESADVDLVSLVHDRQEASHAAGLAGMADRVITLPVPRLRNTARCVPALATARPLTLVLLDSPDARATLARLLDDHRPDVILAFCSGMARFALEPPLAGLPLVVDLVDVDSAKWRSLADATRWPLSAVYAREARYLARFERHLVRRAFATLVVNEREQTALRAVDPAANAIVVPNGVDAPHFASPRAPSEQPVVVFSGVMDYAPNAQGALWLAREIWPQVTRKRPDARLVLVGASPGPDLRALVTRDPSITVTGTVLSIREYLWDAAVAVAPLRIARGVQNKVIEAVAAGLPCVITPEVDEGIPPEVRPACRVCLAANSFADAIVDLLGQSPGERRALAARANLVVLDWPARMKPLVPILEAAAAGRRRP
jgi:polysaccharide biosynthesis protein PslH